MQWCSREVGGLGSSSLHGLRHHAMTSVTSDLVLVHGGQHFKARPQENVSCDLYACVTGPRWFKIPTEEKLPRFGHALIVHKDQLFVVGGFTSETDKNVAETKIVNVCDT